MLLDWEPEDSPVVLQDLVDLEVTEGPHDLADLADLEHDSADPGAVPAEDAPRERQAGPVESARMTTKRTRSP